MRFNPVDKGGNFGSYHSNETTHDRNGGRNGSPSWTAKRKSELDGLKKDVQLHKFDLDQLEQYSRRESIGICGIDETAGEDTDDLVRELAADIGVTLKPEDIRICGIDETAGEDTDHLVRELAADIGVTLKPEDISVSHRLPGRSGSTRPIIVKFARRNTKTAMMRKGVYINNDLTSLHAKMSRITAP